MIRSFSKTLSPSAIIARRAIARAARQMALSGLVCGTGGNISLRDRHGGHGGGGNRRGGGAGCYITNRGAKLADIGIGGVGWMAWDGEPSPQVSSEWRLHRDILASREEVGAVVHTHSPWASALSCRRQSIRALHYTIAMMGGDDIRCSDYAPFGTEALSRHAMKALLNRRACLLAHHGVVAMGADLDEAMDTAHMVEFLAKVTILAQAGGDPRELSQADIEDLRQRFESYREKCTPGK